MAVAGGPTLRAADRLDRGDFAIWKRRNICTDLSKLYSQPAADAQVDINIS